MFKFKSVSVITIALLLSTSVWAESHDLEQDSSNTHMMQHEAGNMNMMNPKMMAHSQSANMSMMHMQMMHKMMHQFDDMNSDQGKGHGGGNNQGKSKHGGNSEKMTMNPQMMAMRMKHMLSMEQSMKNIESLLSQLLEQGKAN